MTEAEIYRALQDVFNSVFRRSDIQIGPQLSAKDVPGWDSFRHVNLIMATEEYFRIQFLSSDIDDMSTIEDLVRAIARHHPSVS